MRRCFVFLLIASILLSLCGGAFASGEPSGGASGETSVSLTAGDWKFSRVRSDDGYTVTVTQFSGDPDENGIVVVPKILGGGIVTAIGMTAFRNTSIRVILLPDSVQTVEQWAFYDCTSLQYVTSANAAVSVDAAAFQNSPAIVTGEGTAVTVTLTPVEAASGFQLLVLGDYILPAGFAVPSLNADQGILRQDAKGTVSFSGAAWTVAGYDGSGVDLDADEPAVLVVDAALADSFGLSVDELDMTFRALSYADEIEAWGGKDAFYAAVNEIADWYGYGELYHAADDVPLRNSMFDNTFYAIMRNGFQYQPIDGVYNLDKLADFSDVPYLGASNLQSIPVTFFDASGMVDVKNVTFVYDDSIGADYRFFSVGKGTVNLTDCEGASGVITAGTLNFSGTDFTGSFAAGNNGLWDGPVGYIDGTGGYTFRNGNYTGAEAAGAVASFADSSVWTVTHDSYLSGLTIGADASVRGADGHTLVMTVNGVETPIAPGSYEGEIVILVQ